MALQEINWNNFKAKFNNQEQTAFERLCYLLFCKEFGKDTGIFRFKNHAGIETDPIEKHKQVIGWQAKFYNTGLSGHNKDWISSIDTTKTRHPSVNKMIFYTNQEFGQNPKKTDPQYKKEVEDYAKTKGIDIEWRTASYFEAPFVCEQNYIIAQHFFSRNKGVLDAIIEMSLYTKSVLESIRSEISFGGERIKLDRSCFVRSLKDIANTSPVVILSGGAGVGKTAFVKDYYETIKDAAPLYIFKATQFKNITHINQLLRDYGELTASDFINEHKSIDQKYIVIDSAEKLSEIEDQDALKDFLSSLIENNWTIIFTVRHNYLDDLRYQLKEIYSTSFVSLNIPDLATEEVEKLATDYNFSLPHNDRLAILLTTPLYLSVYLQNYPEVEKNISYADFRDIIWRKQIQNSSHQTRNIHRRREGCFLEITKRRVNLGGFFVKADDCDQESLQKLEVDGIIKYDPNAGGYFITHDVYEEWGLDKIIEQSFIAKKDYQSFYQDIGTSLPIRRAFRSWLSDKLLTNDESIKQLIEFTVKDEKIDNHWKDEVLISVLLSDYSSSFFDHFEYMLLQEPEELGSHEESSRIMLLHRILFLLRLACKTIDEDILQTLGIKNTRGIPLKTIFTAPKGSGWESTIAFVNQHKEKLRFRHMDAILPVLDDWNRSYKQGKTTMNASQIALFYYHELTNQDGFYFSNRDDRKDKLIRTILNGSGEIKTELTQIIDKIIAEKDTSHRGRYYELVKMILSSAINSSETSRNLPLEVMKLASLFWFYTPKESHGAFSNYRNDIEQYFNISEEHQEYYPASAFQTPILQLLQTEPRATIDFILSFTNKSIEYFSKTKFARHEVEEVDVVIDDSGTTIKQYISHRIWNIYRGTQVAPDLLESMHMALERWLLSVAKTSTPDVLESYCLYLIRNSRSASITAIITSIVLAQPLKLFNVAKLLFQTKDFFLFDKARVQLDMTAKDIYEMSHDPIDIFKNERIATCDDKHRQGSLENQALSYQIFATKEEGEAVTKGRQEVLWKIFDKYYSELPVKSQETDSHRTWRLFLARMDRRKMKIATEEKDDQVIINFNPEIDSELKQYSEDAQAKSSSAMKHVPLHLWSRNKFERNDDSKKYPQYEDNYALVLSETKKVIEELKDDKSENKVFTLFYHSLPAYVCAVLIRDYLDKLNVEERKFCKDILIGHSSSPLRQNYNYQAGDGVGITIGMLPPLLKLFPEDAKEIKNILLYILFDSHPVGMIQQLSDYSIAAILNKLWGESFTDANSIFLGFLTLKPAYDKLKESIRKENYKHNVYDFSNYDFLRAFSKEYKDEIDKVFCNKIHYSDIPDINLIDIDTLVTAFRILPLSIDNDTHKKFLYQIFPIFSKRLFHDGHRRDDEDRIDYATKHKFLEKLAYTILSSKVEDIEPLLKPFLDDFSNSKDTAEFFSEFVSAEDRLEKYEQFWTVWKLFYPKVVALAKEGGGYYAKEIIRNYLLAGSSWKEEARDWHTLKDRERYFFKKASEDMNNPSTLYSISKFLNDIGYKFKDDGVLWISDMLNANPNLSNQELEINTIYYLENLIRFYILNNRHKIKTDLLLKKHILVILDFLFEKGSVTAYMLREDML